MSKTHYRWRWSLKADGTIYGVESACGRLFVEAWADDLHEVNCKACHRLDLTRARPGCITPMRVRDRPDLQLPQPCDVSGCGGIDGVETVRVSVREVSVPMTVRMCWPHREVFSGALVSDTMEPT